MMCLLARWASKTLGTACGAFVFCLFVSFLIEKKNSETNELQVTSEETLIWLLIHQTVVLKQLLFHSWQLVATAILSQTSNSTVTITTKYYKAIITCEKHHHLHHHINNCI